MAAALGAGWRLAELRERVIDDAWIRLKPGWAPLRGHPLAFAFVWRLAAHAADRLPMRTLMSIMVCACTAKSRSLTAPTPQAGPRAPSARAAAGAAGRGEDGSARLPAARVPGRPRRRTGGRSCSMLPAAPGCAAARPRHPRRRVHDACGQAACARVRWRASSCSTCTPRSPDGAASTCRSGDIDDGLPFEDGSCDVVHANQVIEHIRRTDRFLSEVRRVLAPERARLHLDQQPRELAQRDLARPRLAADADPRE